MVVLKKTACISIQGTNSSGEIGFAVYHNTLFANGKYRKNLIVLVGDYVMESNGNLEKKTIDKTVTG